MVESAYPRRLFFAFSTLVLLLPATSRAEPRPAIAEQIAKTYGLDSFEQIDAIRYTFHLEARGREFVRSWVWQPKTGQVSYEGKDKDGKPVKVTYDRSKLDSAPANVRDEIEPLFVNDEYNLFFPFHVYWDGAEVEDLGTQTLPQGEGSAKRVAVKYPSDGGYNPGDTWELYVGSDNVVEAFAYHRGGDVTPPKNVAATWGGYKKAGPFLFSTDRRGTADGKPVEIGFSDVSVKLAGSDKWLDAQ
ncbi:hypothetical protein GCM10011611_25180 [Aliidongia dinghuensis]|uniref:Uncharacterized protein n=1 Tax=Aliidongia dinghuensis TaxID=1867774 RepID=A0A8J2YTA4_9PROT|nr:hypothetical protein [Aliidongia dinghuensis]GGF18266.1 hypothetical protein GCM10011611_25180 [Aliidongia dinghuensis]